MHTLLAVDFGQVWQTCTYCYMGPFLNGFLVLVVPPIVLAALALILMNKIGNGLGLEKLFCHAGGAILARLFIGMGVASLVWQACVCGYFYEKFASTYSKDYTPWVDQWRGFQHPTADLEMLRNYALMVLACMAVSGLAGIALFALFSWLGQCLTKRIRATHFGGYHHRTLGLAFTVALVVTLLSSYYYIGKHFSELGDVVVGTVAVLAVIGVFVLVVQQLCPHKKLKPSTEKRVLRSGPFWLGLAIGFLAASWFTSLCFAPLVNEPPEAVDPVNKPEGDPRIPPAELLKPKPTTWLQKLVANIGRQSVIYAGYGHESARSRWNGILDEGWLACDTAKLTDKEFDPCVPSSHKAILKRGVTIHRNDALYLDRDEVVALYRQRAIDDYERYYTVFGLFFVNVFIVILVYLFNYVDYAVLGKWGFFSPAVGIILLMHVLMAQDVIIPMFTPHPALTKAGTLFVILLLGGLRVYKLKFPHLDYKNRAAYPPPTTAIATTATSKLAMAHETPCLRNTAPLQCWNPPGIKKAPLVVVCASGGGSRAAAWTTAVLGRLEYEFAHKGYPLPYHFRLMSGASGGMLGVANYVTRLAAPLPSGPLPIQHATYTDQHAAQSWPTLAGTAPQQLHDWLEGTCITNDWLTPTCHRLLYMDIPGIFFPGLPWGLPDRGTAIQHAWQKELGAGEIATSFGALLANYEAWQPQMIFTPMLVEDGRQLVISNLDLQSATLNKIANDASTTVLSRSSVEFFRLLKPTQEAHANNFTVATATRMSATFPYLLPAVPLPTDPPRRVVDAGYYDNYGVQITSAWLKTHRKWIYDNYSGVLVIQIRDGLSEGARRLEPPAEREEPAGLAARSLQWLSSPLSGLLSARVASTSFRNDNLLDVLDTIFTQETGTRGFFRVASFEFDEDDQVSLSFRLTNNEIAGIARAAANLKGIPELLAWWEAHLERTPPTT